MGKIFAFLRLCLLHKNYPNAKIKPICLYEINRSSIVKITPALMFLPTFSRNFPPAKITTIIVVKDLTTSLIDDIPRKRSDSVLWQNPLYHQKIRKLKDNTQTPQKTSITQRLRTDLGRSVWVTSHPTGVVKPVNGYPILSNYCSTCTVYFTDLPVKSEMHVQTSRPCLLNFQQTSLHFIFCCIDTPFLRCTLRWKDAIVRKSQNFVFFGQESRENKW